MSTESTAEVRPPSPWLLLAEGGRAPWEYAATLAAMPWLNRVPPGDPRDTSTPAQFCATNRRLLTTGEAGEAGHVGAGRAGVCRSRARSACTRRFGNGSQPAPTMRRASPLRS